MFAFDVFIVSQYISQTAFLNMRVVYSVTEEGGYIVLCTLSIIQNIVIYLEKLDVFMEGWDLSRIQNVTLLLHGIM